MSAYPPPEQEGRYDGQPPSPTPPPMGGGVQPGYAGGFGPSSPPPNIPNHLVGAILVTLFCCLPFGVVSIVYASQVNSFVTGGNYPAAYEASGKASFWVKMAFFFGLIPMLLYAVVMIIGIVSGSVQGMQ